MKKCEFCGCDDLELKYLLRDKNFKVPGKFLVLECPDCKSLLTLLHFKNEIKEFYPKEYYAFGYIKKFEDSLKVSIKLLLNHIYYNDNFYPQLNFLRILLSPVKFLIRGTRIIKGDKLLDIGCGNGQFMYEIEQCGMEVYGIEPHVNALNKDVKPDLYKAKYKKENFDVITMNHVLQHVENPKKMLKEIHRVLKKDGLFIVSASNTRSLASWLFGSNWVQLDIPRHLFNCSDFTLIRFLQDNGFKVIKNRHNSRPNQFVVSLYHLFGMKNNGGFVNRLLEGCFLPLTWFVNLIKLGDQVELWCIKEEC